MTATRAVEVLDQAPWEQLLDRLEQPGAWEEGDFHDLQLVIAQQLRELILAIRPLLKHPLLRRF
jgi:hypothetical protein